MARKSTPQPLTLANPQLSNEPPADYLDVSKSPLSPISPKTPRSPFRFTNSKKAQQEEPLQVTETHHHSPTAIAQSTTVPSLSQYSSGQDNIKPQQRDRSSRSGFFSNYKASKSSSRLQNESTIKAVPLDDNMSRDTDRPPMPGRASSKDTTKTVTSIDKTDTKRPTGSHSKSDASLDSSTELPPSTVSSNGGKKNKPKPFSILARTRSIHLDTSPTETSPTDQVIENTTRTQPQSETLNTAPLLVDGDRSFRSMMASNIRQHSADRAPGGQRDRSRDKKVKENGMNARSQTLTNLAKEHNRNAPSMSASNSGHNFLNSLKSQATKGAGGISKALFGKGGRSGSSNERAPEVDDLHYVLKILNMPLVQQTRTTRISKKLEDSKDKTEFWMPALPWRCIDYLNYKGSDVEGLYRVPGSGNEVKKWQRRFDEEHDIDLFKRDDLYDINIIGSMLKAWFRDLPDEILPLPAQDRISREALQYGVDVPVPQSLIEELSNLPPFNYYLLFAITCHLSLLLAHSATNKMNFPNLTICFQPCLKIDRFIFKFLVCDWRDCWKGCNNESYYVDQEYQYFEQNAGKLASTEGGVSIAVESATEDRNISSSDSSKLGSIAVGESASASRGRQESPSAVAHHSGKDNIKPTNKSKEVHKTGTSNGALPLAQSADGGNTVSTTLTVVDERAHKKRTNTQGGNVPNMRPLSPIAPLSPLGL